jgi:hypothetical protein
VKEPVGKRVQKLQHLFIAAPCDVQLMLMVLVGKHAADTHVCGFTGYSLA